MSYKISITLDIPSKWERDEFMRNFRSFLLAQPAAIEGKIKQTTEQEIMGKGFLSLFGFGVEELEPRPVEVAITEAEAEAATTDDAEAEPEPEGDEVAVAVAEEEPEVTPLQEAIAEAEASDGEGDEPRTPFDDLLGRDED